MYMVCQSSFDMCTFAYEYQNKVREVGDHFSIAFKVNRLFLVGKRTTAVNPGLFQMFWNSWQVFVI